MSSITDPRLAMIGAAIDELAEASRAASGSPGPGQHPRRTGHVREHG